jgi:hypothetical protein
VVLAPPVVGLIDPKARLHAMPLTLHVIWEELVACIGDNKPASEFTREERGKVKGKYHCRKILWDLIGQLVRAGLSSDAAIDHIHASMAGMKLSPVYY